MFCLKELRLESGLKRSELARLTGIHQNTIANYENETRQAPYETLILFADFFDVSLDELLGRSRRENFPQPNAAVLTTRERRLIAAFRNFNEEDKSRAEDYFSLLARPLCGEAELHAFGVRRTSNRF